MENTAEFFAPNKMTPIVIAALAGASLAVLLVGCVARYAGERNSHTGWSRWEKSAKGNGHWYKAVLMTNGISWREADKLARAVGGYLATITSAAENGFVFRLLGSEFFNDFGSGSVLGGVQAEGATEPDGGWGWVTGEPWTFALWEGGNPDNTARNQ